MIINMLTAAEIKLIKSLKDKKFREETGLFVVEGEKMVDEALRSGWQIKQIYRRSEIGPKAMERISHLSSPSEALALVCRRRDEKHTAALRKGGLYLALDAIRDPGNMGTIIRIADWFGLDGIFASEDSVDIFNPKVVQSTMGAIFRVPFRYCPLEELHSGALLFGTFLEGENIYNAELSSDLPRIIVIGNEANGISAEVSTLCSRRLTIPSFASAQGSESLNAAVATAITVSEFRRR